MSFIQGTVLYYLNKGGWVTWVLFLISIVAVAIIIERFIVLYKAKIDVNEFLGKVRSLLLEDNVDDAVVVCEQYGGPVPSIFKAGLLRYSQGRSRSDIEKVVENAAVHELSRLEKRLGILASITNVAPMLGFLGTVVGMIQSFEVIAREGLEDPTKVAAGISLALITTAGGLIVAVLTLPFYNFFTTKIGAFVQEMETSANFLFETFEEVKEFATTGSTGGKKKTGSAPAPPESR
jgi:biopolymer transport protein ExbB